MHKFSISANVIWIKLAAFFSMFTFWFSSTHLIWQRVDYGIFSSLQALIFRYSYLTFIWQRLSFFYVNLLHVRFQLSFMHFFGFRTEFHSLFLVVLVTLTYIFSSQHIDCSLQSVFNSRNCLIHNQISEFGSTKTAN